MSRHKKTKAVVFVFLGLSLIAVAAIVGSFVWLNLQQRPVNPTAQEPINVTINPGQSVDSIGQTLTEHHLIRSPLVFKYVVWQKGLAQKLQAGRFDLTASASMPEIVETLTVGKATEFWVRLLEGWRREEMAEALAQGFIAQGLPFDKAVFLELTQDKEGYLFPDSYLLPHEANEAYVISLLENTFTKKIASIQNDIDASPRTLADSIVMASLIEREARIDTSRQMVSGILWKRLDNNWPLQVDATLQYIKGSSNNWWPTPLGTDKNLTSPYNTYQNTGLPPAPIANPSLSSIKAALKPAASEYWYYISDLQGTMHYGITLDDHNANVNQYLR